MRKAVAVTLVASLLSGCTVQYGRAYGDGRSQMELDMAVTRCEREAELAFDGGKQFVAFMMGATIVFAPFGMIWEADEKRKAWRKCMADRGFRTTRS